MDVKLVKRYSVLAILFFLPVGFLLMLLPATHNYNKLDTIKEQVAELPKDSDLALADHITVLAFYGKKPLKQAIAASNLKELIYDKFKGFKKFQVVAVLEPGAEADLPALQKEIDAHEDLKYWHFVFLDEAQIQALYSSLTTTVPLNNDLATSKVFIIDSNLNQRGRWDDRTEREVELGKAQYDLTSYDCVEVAVLKNKMSEDIRVLFTEYREKRKGNQNSSTRRANDLKGIEDE